MMSKKLFAGGFTALLLLFLPAIGFAQDCIDGIDPGCDPDVYCPCPIDSGLLALITGVILLAAYKARQNYRLRTSS